jgi:hypothetical protein
MVRGRDGGAAGGGGAAPALLAAYTGGLELPAAFGRRFE